MWVSSRYPPIRTKNRGKHLNTSRYDHPSNKSIRKDLLTGGEWCNETISITLISVKSDLVHPEKNYYTSDQTRLNHSKSKIIVQRQNQRRTKCKAQLHTNALIPSTETALSSLHLPGQLKPARSDAFIYRLNAMGAPDNAGNKSQVNTVPNANRKQTKNK